MVTPGGSGPRGRRTAVFVGLVGATVVVVAVKGAGGGASHTVDVGGGPVGPASTTAPTAAPTTTAPPAASSSGPGAPTTTGAPTTGAPATTTAPTTAAEQKLIGSPESFPFGTIQVEVIMSGGRITDVVTVQAPTDGYSAEVAGFSLPRLRQEVLQAQSAHIDVVSGASYDSQAYAQSVQSALDRARS